MTERTTTTICSDCTGSGIFSLGNGQYESCHCGSFSNLSEDEQREQALRCSCRGSDDYCPCQNTPDRETRAKRAVGVFLPPSDIPPASEWGSSLPKTNFANALGLAIYLSEIVKGSGSEVVVVKRDAIISALRLIKDHRHYTQAKRNARSLGK